MSRDHRGLPSGSGSHLAAICDAGSWWEVGGKRPRVVLWDVAVRREVCILPGSSAVLSAEGRWVATIDNEGMVRMWEIPP